MTSRRRSMLIKTESFSLPMIYDNGRQIEEVLFENTMKYGALADLYNDMEETTMNGETGYKLTVYDRMDTNAARSSLVDILGIPGSVFNQYSTLNMLYDFYTNAAGFGWNALGIYTATTSHSSNYKQISAHDLASNTEKTNQIKQIVLDNDYVDDKLYHIGYVIASVSKGRAPEEQYAFVKKIWFE